MTAHIYSEWKWGDPVDDFPYYNVISAIEKHGRKPPPAYGIFCVADGVVLNISSFLVVGGTKGDIEDFVPGDVPNREDIVHVFSTILDKLGDTSA